jgi:hypothetical protein
MDNFSIPERLEPVAPAENTRRQSFTSDQRRRQNQNPTPKTTEEEDTVASQDDEDSHNIDELA